MGEGGRMPFHLPDAIKPYQFHLQYTISLKHSRAEHTELEDGLLHVDNAQLVFARCDEVAAVERLLQRNKLAWHEVHLCADKAIASSRQID